MTKQDKIRCACVRPQHNIQTTNTNYQTDANSFMLTHHTLY